MLHSIDADALRLHKSLVSNWCQTCNKNYHDLRFTFIIAPWIKFKWPVKCRQSSKEPRIYLVGFLSCFLAMGEKEWRGKNGKILPLYPASLASFLIWDVGVKFSAATVALLPCIFLSSQAKKLSPFRHLPLNLFLEAPQLQRRANKLKLDNQNWFFCKMFSNLVAFFKNYLPFHPLPINHSTLRSLSCLMCSIPSE